MRSILVSLTVLALAAPAYAQVPEEPPPPPVAPPTTAPTGERLVMPAKRLYVHALLEIELAKDTAFDPVSLAPDVFYGVSSALTVGLVHSGVGVTGFIGGSGSSLCFTDACDGVYNGVGLDARYHATSGKVTAAIDAGLFATDLDPFQLALKLGVIGRYRPSPASKLAIDFAPSLFIGITEREPAMLGGTGNKEVFLVPATVLYAATPRVAVMAQTGLALPFENAGDLFFVPLSLGASFAVNKQVSVEAALSFLHLLGGDALATGFDARSFTIGVGYAL